MSDIANHRLSRIIEGRAPSRGRRQLTQPHTPSLYSAFLDMVFSKFTLRNFTVLAVIMVVTDFHPQTLLALIFSYFLIGKAIGDPRMH
jgi:hypothetical protein